MNHRQPKESQRAYVERQFRETGQVRAYDVLYSLYYADGRKCSISRLAAIVLDLRKEGWDIATKGGQLAEYHLITTPEGKAAPRVEGWQQGWACVVCGSLPASVPSGMGGLGFASCANCGTRTAFRKQAA